MEHMIAGSLTVDKDGVVAGMIGGNVIVKRSVRASITAMVAGDVVVEDGAEVDVTGMVAGRIVGNARGSGMVGQR